MISDSLSSFVKRHTSWLVLFAYTLLTVVMTWPVAARLATHVPGGTVDLWTHRWTYWWIEQSIAEGHNPFYTQLLFHPQGVSLAFHNIAWVNIAAWLPLQAVFGGNTAYSLTFLVFCTLNAFAMYLLAREFLDSLGQTAPLAAFIGGLVYGFWPYAMSQFGHPNMKVTCWVPLALLYLRRTLDERRVRDALLTALFLALTGLTRWQLLLMAGVLFALYLLCRFLQEKSHWNGRTLGLLALIGLVAAALMAPLAAPVASALLARDGTADVVFTEEASAQTDLLAYVLPTPYHPLWNQAAERIYENFTHNKVYVPFLGYTALAVGFYGVIRRWRRTRFWLLVASVYVALALGPVLRINGQLYPQIPMPYRLVGDLFFIRAVRVPSRFNLFLNLPVAMMVAFGVEAITHQRFRKLMIPLTLALAALILREYSLVPYHTERPVTPGWYEQLAQEPGQFAVLDLPIGLQTFNKRYMFYQITHRKPLVEGKVARPPREAFAFIESNPFLDQLHRHNVMDPALVNVSHQLRELNEAGIRYVILHKAFATDEQLTAWRDWLAFDPLHEDEDLVVYRTAARWGCDFAFAHRLTDDIGLVQATFAPTETIQGAVLDIDARWGSSAAPGRDYDACTHLTSADGEIAHTDCAPLSTAWPTSRWRDDEVVRSLYRPQIPLSLEPGTYSLTLTLRDSALDNAVGEPAALGPIRVDALQPAHAQRVTFGDAIRLRGYDLQRSDDALALTFYWEAQQAMETSYKVFVHLVDPESGDVVAQDDAIPRHWTYPTTRWRRGEIVWDPVSLSLGDVPAGRYRLMVGWYDAATGERLRTDDGGDAFLLTTLPAPAR